MNFKFGNRTLGYHTGSVCLLLAFALLLIVSLLVLHHRPKKPLVGSSNPDSKVLFLSLFAGANTSIVADLRVLKWLHAAGLRTLTREYTLLLSYPAHAFLALLRPNWSFLTHLSVDEPAEMGLRFMPSYHAYALSCRGIVEAVFVNLGHKEDFLTFERLRVAVHDRVMVVLCGGGYLGGVVE